MINWLLYNSQTINFGYALVGLAVLGATLVLGYDYFLNNQRWYRLYLAPFAWLTLGVTIFGGVATTLFYSEILGFIPCSLCWLQRIALYPQLLLVIGAFRWRDAVYFPRYGIILSTFGLFVATYQYLLQLLPPVVHESGILPCLADGSADCAKKIMEVFGFVTFPFLSGVLFLFLITLYLHLLRDKPSK